MPNDPLCRAIKEVVIRDTANHSFNEAVRLTLLCDASRGHGGEDHVCSVGLASFRWAR